MSTPGLIFLIWGALILVLVALWVIPRWGRRR